MELFLPESDRDYLTEKQYSFLEVNHGTQRGVIIQNWPLPAGKFSGNEVELLILIPTGYRDVPLDMFYVYPRLTFSGGTQIPKTDQNLAFNGKTYQRWSRHLPPGQWRSGIDGLHTFLHAIQKAFEEAKS